MAARRHVISAIHQVLFALNFGLATAIGVRAYVARFAPGRSHFADFSFNEIVWINHLFRVYPEEYNRVGVELTFLLWIVILAVIVLAVMQLVGRSRLESSLLHAAGFAAVGAVPVLILCVYLAGYAFDSVPFVEGNLPWLIVETVAAAGLVALFLVGKWPVPIWLTFALFLFHYGLWSWVLWQLFSPIAWSVVLSGIPALAGIAWILYEKQELRFEHGAECRVGDS